jgi:uncharacterized protein (DUF433 family)
MILDRLTFEPGKLGGKACIRSQRISASTILHCLAAGMSTAEILEAYPYLEAEDIRQTLHFAARLAEERMCPLQPEPEDA